MKILFNNVFEDATFTATNESLNYPVANLIHPFLHKRFQSSSTSSVITASFSADQSISCFFYGYFVATALSVVFKDSGGSTLKTLTISDPEDIGVEYFTALTTVRSVEITLTGTYLGGIGAGLCYCMPNPLAAYAADNGDNSDFTESPDGQTLQTYIKPLRELDYNFREIETKKTIDDNYKLVGVGKPLYIDIYEDNRDKEDPIYGKIMRSLSFRYQPRRYSTSIKIREAR